MHLEEAITKRPELSSRMRTLDLLFLQEFKSYQSLY
jgi:hypothetical protein